jgi:hypothetical protein
MSEMTKITSSSADLCGFLNQISNFWKCIDWPDDYSFNVMLNESVENITKAAIFYAYTVKERAINSSISYQSDSNNEQQNNSRSESSYDNYQNNNLTTTLTSSSLSTSTTQFELFHKFIIQMNSVEKVREHIVNFLNDLNLSQIGISNSALNRRDSKQKQNNEIEYYFNLLNDQMTLNINSSSLYLIFICGQLNQLIFDCKISQELQPHMFHLFESPENVSLKESVSRIVRYFNVSLPLFNEYTFKINFDRLTILIWTKMLYAFELYINKDYERTPLYFNRISDAVDLIGESLIHFHNLNKKMSTRSCIKDLLFTTNDTYKELKKYLKCLSMDTPKLINAYYVDILQIQNSLKTSLYGTLICRSYYVKAKEKLIVEILKCKNLKPMDQNGLSDPVIIILILF